MVAMTDEVDSERLGRVMKALANPVRVDLLKALRSPKTITEIRLHPRRKDGNLHPERVMSRVTVREHLVQLLDIGVVQARRATREGRTVDVYIVNHRQLFALTEELRQLAELRPDGQTVGDATQEDPVEPPRFPEGPKLVLAGGIPKGRVFPLNGDGERWRIGRHRGAEVWLDYDPYLSSENAEVVRTRKGFVLHDLGRSRNGTYLNWEELARGAEAPLSDGDLIGVGRSVLVFRSR